ncbi:hypothetical protein BRDID11002_28460 [Bradyrhizobium diazoefficiens]
MEGTPETIAARRIAYAAHRFPPPSLRFVIIGKLMPKAPMSIGAFASHGSFAAIRTSGVHGVPVVAAIIACASVRADRPVLEIDDDPVERARHDLHGLHARDGRDGAEGGAALAPQLAETVERRGLGPT